MGAYILRRLLLMLPTIFGILLISFTIVQFAPGGPVERIIAELEGTAIDATSRIGGTQGGDFSGSNVNPNAASDASVKSKYRGEKGIDKEIIKKREKNLGLNTITLKI